MASVCHSYPLFREAGGKMKDKTEVSQIFKRKDKIYTGVCR